MKLLISLSYYYPHISGLTLYAKNLAEGFAERGTNVSILTSQHDKQLPLYETEHEVHIIRVPVTFRFSKGPIMLGFLSKSIKEVRKADVINCHLPQFESFIIALLAKCFGKKFVVTYHTDLHVEKGFIQKIIRFGLLLSHSITCQIADSIVVQTKDNALHSDFLKRFVHKLVFIYPPILPPVITSHIGHDSLLRRVENRDVYCIGFLGRMAKEKGIEYLLEAMPEISKKTNKKCLLLIAGPADAIGEQRYKKKIATIIQKEIDSIIMLGSLTEQEKGSFYKILDVLVLPSVNTTEAFGMVQIEAMYCGTPVIATDLPGVRVPIHETKMGEIVPPANKKALTDAIITVLHNREKYVKPFETIQKIFSIEKILNSYNEIFFDNGN